MVPPNHDGAFEFAFADHLIECQACAVALAQANPADACRQALEADALLGHVQPAVQVLVFRKQLLHLGVGLQDVLGVTTEGHPAEGAHASAKQRPNVGGHKAGIVESVGKAEIFGHLAQVVAIVHGGNAHVVEVQHGAHMGHTGFAGSLFQCGML